MRTVQYRGGVITFEVPDDWVDEPDGPDGGMAYYADEPDSPTLFVHVLTLQHATEHLTPTDVHAALSRRAERTGQTAVTFPNGNPALVYSHPFEDRGRPGVLHRWEVARAAPPHHFRLAIFTLSVAESQRASAEAAGLVELVDRIAKGCAFAPRVES